MRRHLRIIVPMAALGFSLLLSACSTAIDGERGGTQEPTTGVTTTLAVSPPASPAPVGAKKPWTVMVYSVADTDLEPSMIADVNEMGAVGSNEHLTITALVDRSPDYADDPVLDIGSWAGGRVLDIGKGTATIVTDAGKVNLGDPQTLANFIAESIGRHPADNYALIISDHGASWPGIGPDESHADMLTLPELDSALTAGLKAAGVPRLSILGFDACLMSSYEVASTLARHADRMIASEEVEPGHGWDYRSLGILSTGTPVTSDQLGGAILAGYLAQAKAEETAANVTLAVLDLTRIATLDQTVAAFAKSLATRPAPIGRLVGRVRADAIAYGRSADSKDDAQMVDLGDLVGRIGVEALDVSALADAITRAENDMVVKMVEGAAAIKSTGLSVYFPSTKQQFDPDYVEALGDTPWRGFLAAYFGAGDAIAADRKPKFAGDATARQNRSAAQATASSSSVIIRAELDPGTAGNVVDAVIRYGMINSDDSVTYLGERDGVNIADGQSAVSGEYDFTAVFLSDGTQRIPVYALTTLDTSAGLATLDVPLRYLPPGRAVTAEAQQAALSLVIDTPTSRVVSHEFYSVNEKTGAYGHLYTAPGGKIVADAVTIAADGTETWAPLAATALNADLDTISATFARLPSGTAIYLELSVIDFGGNEAFAATDIRIP